MSERESESRNPAGTGGDPGGSGPGGEGDPERSGGGDTRRYGRWDVRGWSRDRWAQRILAGFAAAAVLAVLAYLLATLVNQVREGEGHRQEIEEKVDDLQDDIQDLPAVVSTSVPVPGVTGLSGPPGEPGRPGVPGRPGQVVTAPPRTVVITTPGPTFRPTMVPAPRPEPSCAMPLLGACLVKGESP